MIRKLLFKLRLSLFAAIAAWRQADDACEAVANSCETGGAWNDLEYGAGFVDLYVPVYSHVYAKGQS
jgi:hypothetical protein